MFKHASIRRTTHIRLLLPAAALAVGAALANPSHAAGTVVNVSLWDKGGNLEMPTDLGFPAAGKDMSNVTMGIAVSVDAVNAGEVTFEVLNSSKDIIHELIVARLKSGTATLPYLVNEFKVDEDKAGSHLGEVSELDPGKTGALRLDLKPGTYLLYCNIPGHYMAGMWTLFTVK
jgi:uncharacterized cupredoxin-like copper-binding protein